MCSRPYRGGPSHPRMWKGSRHTGGNMGLPPRDEQGSRPGEDGPLRTRENMKRLLILIAAVWALQAGAAFKCVDERGLTHIGDTPPPGCARVMMYEVTPSGKVLRQIEPTPTPE